MKKVLFVASVTSHIITFHTPYLKWFKEQGYEVHVASKGIQKIEYCDTHFEIPFERSPFKMKNLKAYKELKKIMDAGKYDIIHCHTPVASVLTRIAARKTQKVKGTRVVYTAHGFHFYKGAPLINWICYYPIEKVLARRTDCLITITREDYKFAKKHLNAKRIEHIDGIGMNTKKFEKEISNQEKEDKRKEFDINSKDIVFTYVAELNQNKNQILLIDTIKELKKEITNIRLLLVGSGILEEEYRNIVKKNNLEENIKILGRRKDINEILSITDIYLASSKREGLPVNIIEAMYKGLPIIATDNRGHRELIKENKNGYLIDINDKNKLKEKILELVNNQEERKALGKNGKEISNRYQLKNVIEKMNNIYLAPRKRIMHILNSNSYSGAENVVITIINNMKDNKDYEFFYASPDGKIKEILKQNNINYIPLSKVDVNTIRKMYKEYKPDIIHAHDFTASIVCAISFVKAKIISHIHNNSPWIKKYNLYSIIYLLSSFKYEKILTVSESVTNEYIFGNIIKEKVEIIGNPIDIQEIIRKSKKEDSDEKYDVIFLGRLTEPKHPEQFIELISKMKKETDVKAAMIGNGPLKEKCEDLIKKYKMEDTIILKGFMENPYKILKNIKILCMTSKWEGFGLVAIEALTLGKPVVATKVGGIPNIVQKKCGVTTNNANEMIEEMKLLLTDSEYYKQKSLGAIERAQEMNNIDKYIKRLNNIYKQCIRKGE